MACVQNPLNPDHEDSEREEGEIVDELDELSDISSEEEFLLRQRLHMLEKYNNVLERKNAKRTTVVSEPGKKAKSNDTFLCDLSEISASELEEYVDSKDVREQKPLKSYPKPKRRKDTPIANNLAKRVHRKKSYKSKKKSPVLPESSDESDDEYRNKRRKLAVAVNKGNVDKTSLKARLEKMLCVAQNPESERFFPNLQSDTPHDPTMNDFCLEKIHDAVPIEAEKDDNQTEVYESIDLCSDVDTKDSGKNGSAISEPPAGSDIKNNGTVVNLPLESYDTVDSVQNATAKVENVTVDETQNNKDSDEDLELLRAHALKTKTEKSNSKNSGLDKQNEERNNIIEEKDALMLSGDEDSDTAELRLICLKSALLKKAFERKQKQKLRKRLSQSLNLNEELMRDQIEYMNQISDNNTDIESVDMEIVSDGDEKSKDSLIESLKPTGYEKVHSANSNKDDLMKLIIPVEDEFEEDEDLLRAKLLTSLSKNLPNLVHPNVMNSIKDSESPKTDQETEKHANNVPEDKRFIITIGNSDSEGEHEATKNLTKMHMKLSEQQDFQQKLDLFLKSTRMEVEKAVLPDVVQQPLLPPPLPKTKEKFVPKTVNHLPKSEQIEYKNLVKRMAELEKIKNARQSSINLVNKGVSQQKDTLKPRNFGTRDQATNKDLEEQIAMSRKTIAEESAKVLKLKEEATKLSHKYKIVSTELRNLATAITLNKKQQKVAQINLSKIRTQHQLLINSSTASKHSPPNGNLGTMVRSSQKLTSSSKRPQKENAPLKEASKGVPYSQSTISDLQSVKVSVVNDLMEEQNTILSVQIDVANNKKTVKLPNNPNKNSFSVENSLESRIDDGRSIDARETLDRGKGKKDNKELNNSNWGSKHKTKDDDYKSPLQALGSANWEDPNAVLCRFEVGGNCKDPDCKYLHPKIQEQ